MAIFSIVGIVLGIMSYKNNESKFGAIVLVLIGIVILLYLGLIIVLDAACGTGGDC